MCICVRVWGWWGKRNKKKTSLSKRTCSFACSYNGYLWRVILKCRAHLELLEGIAVDFHREQFREKEKECKKQQMGVVHLLPGFTVQHYKQRLVRMTVHTIWVIRKQTHIFFKAWWNHSIFALEGLVTICVIKNPKEADLGPLICWGVLPFYILSHFQKGPFEKSVTPGEQCSPREAPVGTLRAF